MVMRYVSRDQFFICPIFQTIRPLQRPRSQTGSARPYQPLGNQAALRSRLREVFDGNSFSGEFFLSCHFYYKGKRRGDIDNLLKAVLDALQDAKIITNDKNCVGIVATMNPSDESFVVIELSEAILDEISA